MVYDVISWRSVLLMEYPEKTTDLSQVSDKPYHITHNAVSSTPLHERDYYTQLTVTENVQLSNLRRNNVCHAPYTQTIHTITPVTKQMYQLYIYIGVIYEASVSRFSIRHYPFVFSNVYLSCVLCLVYPMLPVSLDSPSVITLWFSLTFICLVSCVSNVASVSRLCILDCPLVFSNVYLSCVLCIQCCQCL